MSKLIQSPASLVKEAFLFLEKKMTAEQLIEFLKDQIGVTFKKDESSKSRKWIGLTTTDNRISESSDYDRLLKFIPRQSVISRVEPNGLHNFAVFLK